MRIADRIQNLRKQKGISQEELADRMGVSRQAVSKWESGQALPDLEKIIILSGYFNVTTDYILKGEACSGAGGENNNVLVSGILYIASAAFMGIGLFCAFGSWYEKQSAECIWGAMIVQAAGAAAYFIGRLLSQREAAFSIQWLNLLLVLFMPLSLLSTAIFGYVPAPYPIEIVSGCIFGVLYLAAAVLTFFILKKRRAGH